MSKEVKTIDVVKMSKTLNVPFGKILKDLKIQLKDFVKGMVSIYIIEMWCLSNNTRKEDIFLGKYLCYERLPKDLAAATCFDDVFMFVQKIPQDWKEIRLQFIEKSISLAKTATEVSDVRNYLLEISSRGNQKEKVAALKILASQKQDQFVLAEITTAETLEDAVKLYNLAVTEKTRIICLQKVTTFCMIEAQAS